MMKNLDVALNPDFEVEVTEERFSLGDLGLLYY